MRKIQFLSKNSLCADDFQYYKSLLINIDHIESMSEIKEFHTPLSEKYIGKYFTIMMLNGNKYYCNESQYLEFLKMLI